MAKLLNRVAVLTATTGTGTVTLGSALSGAFCTFAQAGATDSDVVTYMLTEGSDFEIGRGTYTASGTTLSRDTVLLSKISGTAGTTKMTLAGGAEVRVIAAAEDIAAVNPESGSGTNGSYVKHPDGRLECWINGIVATGSGSTNYAQVQWTFPVAFVDTNYVVNVNPSNHSAQWVNAAQVQAAYCFGNTGTSTTACTVGVKFESNQSSPEVTLYARAIGWWK